MGESRVRGQSARDRVCGNARFGKLGWELQVWLVTCGLWGGTEGCHHFKVFWPVSHLAVTDRGTSYSFKFCHSPLVNRAIVTNGGNSRVQDACPCPLFAIPRGWP